DGTYPVAALRPSAVDEDQRPVHAATVTLGAHPITGACAEMDGSPRPSCGPELSPLPVGVTSCSPHNWGLGPLSAPVVGSDQVVVAGLAEGRAHRVLVQRSCGLHSHRRDPIRDQVDGHRGHALERPELLGHRMGAVPTRHALNLQLLTHDRTNLAIAAVISDTFSCGSTPFSLASRTQVCRCCSTSWIANDSRARVVADTWVSTSTQSLSLSISR